MDILIRIQQGVEQEYMQRFRRDIQELEHLRYVSILPARPRLTTLEGVRGECAICQEDFKEGEKIVSLPCNPTHPHKFHRHCVEPWLKYHDTCPTCRGKV